MDRRTFLKGAGLAAAATFTSGGAFAAERYFPSKVDQGLFTTINKVKDPTQPSPLEKRHAPVIKAPGKVRAGEPFTVEVSVGEDLHSMGPAHWIEYVSLDIGNEPAGRADFQPKGYLSPRVAFTVVLAKESAPEGKVTLVAHQRCNLHGYWEGSLDIAVTD